MQGIAHPNIHDLNIWWDKGQKNILAYLIKGRMSAVIDTGPRQVLKDTLTTELQSHNLTFRDIDLILNTHGHWDHIGGNAALKAAGHAQICIHKEDAVFLQDQQRCFDLFEAPLARALGRDIEKRKTEFLKEMEPEMAVDRCLEDNDIIDIGNGIELRVIHLPGHTLGSVGFYWEREGILFSGDSVSGLGSPGGSLPIIVDLASYEKSIERLLEMPLQGILGSHLYRGLDLAPSAVRQGSEIKAYLNDSREVARIIADALQRRRYDEDKSLFDIADDVIGEFPEVFEYKRIAAQQTSIFTLTTVFFGLSQAMGLETKK